MFAAVIFKSTLMAFSRHFIIPLGSTHFKPNPSVTKPAPGFSLFSQSFSPCQIFLQICRATCTVSQHHSWAFWLAGPVIWHTGVISVFIDPIPQCMKQRKWEWSTFLSPSLCAFTRPLAALVWWQSRPSIDGLRCTIWNERLTCTC